MIKAHKNDGKSLPVGETKHWDEKLLIGERKQLNVGWLVHHAAATAETV